MRILNKDYPPCLGVLFKGDVESVISIYFKHRQQFGQLNSNQTYVYGHTTPLEYSRDTGRGRNQLRSHTTQCLHSAAIGHKIMVISERVITVNVIRLQPSARTRVSLGTHILRDAVQLEELAPVFSQKCNPLRLPHSPIEVP